MKTRPSHGGYPDTTAPPTGTLWTDAELIALFLQQDGQVKQSDDLAWLFCKDGDGGNTSLRSDWFAAGLRKVAEGTGAAREARAHACVNFCGDIPTEELEPGGYEAHIIATGLECGSLKGALHELLERARELAERCDRMHSGDQPFGASFATLVALLNATIKRVDAVHGSALRALAALAAQVDWDAL